MFYLNCFFIYSILGYFLETIYTSLLKVPYKSGFLHGPWTPVYGIGAVVILIISYYFFMNLHMPRWLETVIVFFIMAIFLSCLELMGGVLIEKVFNVTFWDYTNMKFNIGKYISLEMALIWGAMTTIFIYVINPLLEKFIKKVPTSITIILSILFVVDFAVTIVKGIRK